MNTRSMLRGSSVALGALLVASLAPRAAQAQIVVGGGVNIAVPAPPTVVVRPPTVQVAPVAPAPVYVAPAQPVAAPVYAAPAGPPMMVDMGDPMAEASVYAAAPPPAPIVETPPPAPVAGYVWVPGHWRWHGNRYVWARGRWMAPRGAWVPGGWQARGGRWMWRPGRWAGGPAGPAVVAPAAGPGPVYVAPAGPPGHWRGRGRGHWR